MYGSSVLGPASVLQFIPAWEMGEMARWSDREYGLAQQDCQWWGEFEVSMEQVLISFGPSHHPPTVPQYNPGEHEVAKLSTTHMPLEGGQ